MDIDVAALNFVLSVTVLILAVLLVGTGDMRIEEERTGKIAFVLLAASGAVSAIGSYFAQTDPGVLLIVRSVAFALRVSLLIILMGWLWHRLRD